MLSLAIIFCLFFPKHESFQLLNTWHNPLLDLFFVNCTHLGDGLVSVAVVLLLIIFKKRKEALTVLVAYISSGLFAQLLKNIFVQPRPNLYLKQLMIHYNHFVEGVTLYNNNSFPSGHTTSAFALATVIALLSKNKSLYMSALFLAALVGYSRIYLAEHFLADVLAGALVGIIFGMLSYYLIYQRGVENFPKALHKIKQNFFQQNKHAA